MLTRGELLDKADANIRSALTICRENQLLEKPLATSALHFAALTELRRGDLNGAARDWQAALQLAQRHGQMALEAQCLNHLAEVAVKQNNLD